MKVALDTNVLVSAFATRGLCADLLHVILAEHQLIVGATVLTELRRVLRDKIKAPAEIIQETDAFLRSEALVIERAPVLAVKLRDKSDIPVLAEAVGGGANVLVTGDRDLLDIASNAPLRILTPRGFWEQLRIEPTHG
ncbi:MAG: putative toxin-antitoxin system toxin component, PIN family [Gammaproteobacteria bacterium]|nr:MAG: putative toxin-antitoxin system toxin component, PIN family [Gammaproteobacteria bacterium]